MISLKWKPKSVLIKWISTLFTIVKLIIALNKSSDICHPINYGIK